MDLGDPAADSAVGEGAEITAVEDVFGGLAGDRLVGTAGRAATA